MITRLRFYIFLLILTFKLPMAISSEVTKISENFYVGTSDTKIGVHFVMEKVEQTNINEWQYFSTTQFNIQRDLIGVFDEGDFDNIEVTKEEIEQGKKYKKIIRAVKDPADKFLSCLNSCNEAQVWVAYVTHKEPVARYHPDDMGEVEMSVAVLTNKTVPFVVHMGITRNLKFMLRPNQEPTPNLSAELHAFAARVMLLEEGSQKRFLITTPLRKMTELLTRVLPQGTYWVGSNQEGGVIQEANRLFMNYTVTIRDPNDSSFPEFRMNRSETTEFEWFFWNTQAGAVPYLTVYLNELASMFGKE